jgi:hypothetical protein
LAVAGAQDRRDRAHDRLHKHAEQHGPSIMTDTANLGLPFIEGSQAQKHVTHNEALRILDAAIQISVLDLTRTAPPSSPAEGERHVVASGATGAWAGHANAIATWQNGAWAFLVPNIGWCIWSVADNVVFVFDGSVWRDLRNLAVDNLPHLGINTAASSPNLFSVKSNAALLAAVNAADGGSGDARLQISKESASKTASVFFSDAFSGRAEFGLAGDDNFHLKVSPDGSAWSDALAIDRSTGKITLLGFSNTASSRTLLAAAPSDALAYSGMQLNGAMEVAQENGASVVALTATGALQFKYLLDGVMAGARGTFAATAQQVAAPSGMPAAKALKIAVTTAQSSLGANDELTVMLPTEGVRTSRLLSGTSLASPQSLGFWFCAHRTGAYSGTVMNAGKTRACPFSFTVTAADTPQWISLSGANAIAADTAGTWLNDNNVGSYLTICLAAGASRVGAAGAWATTTSPGLVGVTGTNNGVGSTSDVFYIGNLIALPGIELPPSDRSPLVMRPFDQERLACMRYWQKSCDYATAIGAAGAFGGVDVFLPIGSTGDIKTQIIFPVPMRAVPAITLYDDVGTSGKVYKGGSGKTGAADHIAQTGFRGGSSDATNAQELFFQWAADARF